MDVARENARRDDRKPRTDKTTKSKQQTSYVVNHTRAIKEYIEHSKLHNQPIENIEI
jgi:hypothetical protein